MRIFYDTEFFERGPDHPIQLISIGMVRDDGTTLYAVNANLDQHAVSTHPWLRHHVWPHLPLTPPLRGMRGGTRPRLDTDHPDVRPRAQIARMVQQFVLDTDHPQLWADHAAYDHVVLAQLFGTMVQLPAGFPMWTADLQQELARRGQPFVPPPRRTPTDEPDHHALGDARRLRECAHWFDRQDTP